jgi:hypothetical protein
MRSPSGHVWSRTFSNKDDGSSPPSPKPKAKPRAKAKPARLPPPVVDEEEDGPYEAPSGLTSSFYDTMIIV